MDFIFQNIQSFLFLIKLRFHTIYLRREEQLFWIYWFLLEKKKCERSRKKKAESLECVRLRSFKLGITGLHLYLTIA